MAEKKQKEIPKAYDPSVVEDKWYKYWQDNKIFHSEIDESKEPYVIPIPPPNVTGMLTMGHILNNTIQDIFIRTKRMKGYNACWVPGTDHASIATETKVTNYLSEQGINKYEIGREEFIKHCWEWTKEYGGIINQQLKKLGVSCDWDRERFTMDDDYYREVIKSFVDLYKDEKIYRGYRMVNWCPASKSAISDEEVIYNNVNGKLWYLKYPVVGTDKYLVVATTRPETMLGDTGVAVNPNDERYKDVIGKKVLLPIAEREIPIFADEYVDMEFGTGAVKVTPAHDINDNEMGHRHNLKVINIFNDDASTNDNVPKDFRGLDRFDARKKVIARFEELDLIEKIEDHQHKVGYSERGGVPIEPYLSDQWFMKMSSHSNESAELSEDELAKPAINVVKEGKINFYPDHWKKTYFHWMENIRSWCISRQLRWGHQIPVYYLPNGEYVVAASMEDAIEQAKELGFNSNDLKQDEDVLDTWFSSALWPLSVFDGIRNPDNPEIKYYYPTNDLVTAPEILFFWVARMIITGYEYRDARPFENVYLTGIVRDDQRRKMSKSLGNSPDPIELMEKYSADGVRVGMLLCSPAGNDLLFDEKLCDQGKKFYNKLWNALRLIKGWEVDESLAQSETSQIAISWFESKFNAELEKINESYKKYKISEALMISYKLIWDDFCSSYLEMIKPAYQQPIDSASMKATVNYLENILKVIHPFMPFITEEIWHLIVERSETDCIIVSDWPMVGTVQTELIDKMDGALEVIGGVRNIRKKKNILPKEQLDLKIKKDDSIDVSCDPVIIKMANLKSIEVIEEKLDGVPSFITGATQYYIDFTEDINVGEKSEDLQKELVYFQGFLKGIDKKLSNSKFVDSAPEHVVAGERKKQQDTQAKIKLIEEQLSSIS
ncbi:MAG: valine--tRNA ligase [Bacteroidetes bacterium]|nr:valine--tRNA ligase [Bacteroidota bacterium]